MRRAAPTALPGGHQRGAWGLAGELGHVTIDEDGPWCSYGNRGCLSTLVTDSAILGRVKQWVTESGIPTPLWSPGESKETITIGDLGRAARSGDKVALQVLDEMGGYVGKAVAIAVNLVGPELIVLGGCLLGGDEVLLAAVQRQVRFHAFQHSARRERIVCKEQSQLAGAQGAALMATDALFESRERLRELLAESRSRLSVEAA